VIARAPSRRLALPLAAADLPALANVSLFGLAEGEDTLVVTFEQDCKSSNLANRTHKRQYWTREGGRWRILFKTVVS
jgi:hypothetical protein